MSAPESRWRDLLDLALPALDHVFNPVVSNAPARWTLGGGTAIAQRIDHRISHDIDLFVPGVPLKLFTPGRNPAAARISVRFQYPGHYLKFERPEGEIDFLSPPLQTEPGYTWIDYKGRAIALETLDEVIVKKIRFRSARFTARDIFDLAAVGEGSPTLPETLASEVPDALERTLDSIDVQAKRGYDAMGASIIATAKGEPLLTTCFELARQVLDEAIRLRPHSLG